MEKILPLIIAPDPLLKRISQPVDNIDDELRSLMKNMVKTMYFQQGVGLAAVQVGVLKRVLVMDVDYEIDENSNHINHKNCDGVHVKNTNPRYFINPEIISKSKNDKSYNEGCLSFPGARAEVYRPESVVVKYLDYEGKIQEEEMTDLMSVCIQHEIDHLNGITFVDHISRLKRDLIIKKIKKNSQ